ncbi:MAG: 30S ribosomal protein S20 [Clostridia bacterium]|nr:30S ribosomal protein S20 [Clostridia bacterium]
MPNIKSAEKRVKVSAKKRLANRWVKAGVKSNTKKFDAALAAGDANAVQAQAVVLTSTVDKAVGKGVFHRNKANRLKSRIARKAAAQAK